tara:strand:- start:1849 stop:2019 length:171 start_codon:yes stop_codon:yes gene_type:complete
MKKYFMKTYIQEDELYLIQEAVHWFTRTMDQTSDRRNTRDSILGKLERETMECQFN